jgi:hypothetical protein
LHELAGRCAPDDSTSNVDIMLSDGVLLESDDRVSVIVVILCSGIARMLGKRWFLASTGWAGKNVTR